MAKGFPGRARASRMIGAREQAKFSYPEYRSLVLRVLGTDNDALSSVFHPISRKAVRDARNAIRHSLFITDIKDDEAA